MLATYVAVIIRIYSLYARWATLKCRWGWLSRILHNLPRALLRAIQAANFGPTPFASEVDLAYARGDCLEKREAALKEWEAFCNSRAKAGGLKLVNFNSATPYLVRGFEPRGWLQKGVTNET
jgi:hypothetical protein